MTAISILDQGRRHIGLLGRLTSIITRHKQIEEGQSKALDHQATHALRVTHALRRRNRELALLNQASQTFNSTLDLDQVLVIILEEVRHLLGVVASSVWLTDPDTDELVCRQATGPQSEIVCGQRLAPGEGIVGWVACIGRSLVVPDTRADERHFKGIDQQTGLALHSILSVPLRAKQNVIGVLQVVDTAVDRFSTADLVLLEALAASAAIAIDNARLVEALHQCTLELEAQNEELDAFNHTVAHDLKNPLALVMSYAEVLEEEDTTIPDEELRHYLHVIAKSGRKIKCIIDELLLLAGARKMEVELEPLDMTHIVAEALQRLALMIEEYQAKIILPGTWPVALGHAPWVEEVWANYISNALKYGGRPPRVELGASSPSVSSAGGKGKGGQVCFWVRDNGSGISPEEQTRLFIPFTRLDQARAKGHGLGLSIVQRIVEKLGGEVDVESQMGQGSVFTFALPGVQAEGRTAS